MDSPGRSSINNEKKHHIEYKWKEIEYEFVNNNKFDLDSLLN